MKILNGWWSLLPIKTLSRFSAAVKFASGRIFVLLFVFSSVQVLAQGKISVKEDTLAPANTKKLALGKSVLKTEVLDSTKLTSARDSTTTKKKRHSPTKAALFSAVLPGMGQAYNKRYWKIPIVYAGFGGLSYAVYYTATEFKGYRNAYRLQVDDDASTNGSYRGFENADELKIQRDYFKRYLDISAIAMAVWYTLNIVDAAVDAHLFEWNMKDDIKLGWQPTVISGANQYPQAALGVRLNLQF